MAVSMDVNYLRGYLKDSWTFDCVSTNRAFIDDSSMGLWWVMPSLIMEFLGIYNRGSRSTHNSISGALPHNIP
jgi:hypothetical protein